MTLYSWGANSHGQLGIGQQSEQETVPKPVIEAGFDFKDIVSIRGGGGHVLILLNNGDIYAAGWNHKGQLGIESLQDESTFHRVCTQLKFKSISCGWDSSAAITTEGDVYIWGSTNVSLPGTPSYFTSPKIFPLPDNERAKAVEYNLQDIVILTASDTLFCARKILDNTAYSSREIILYGPKFAQLNLDIEFDTVRTGQKHLVIQTKNSQLIAIGDNKYGQCGDNSDGYISIPSSYKIKTAECGWTHGGYLTTTGDLLLWGRNDYGQLGSHSLTNFSAQPLKMELAEKITSFSLGSQHGVAITESGDLYTWGWNEHGNCGNGATQNVLIPERIALGGKCTLIGTGAGFCFALRE